jgi:hypothetical protein
VQVAESRFLNNKLVEVVGFMENIAREYLNEFFGLHLHQQYLMLVSRRVLCELAVHVASLSTVCIHCSGVKPAIIPTSLHLYTHSLVMRQECIALQYGACSWAVMAADVGQHHKARM